MKFNKSSLLLLFFSIFIFNNVLISSPLHSSKKIETYLDWFLESSAHPDTNAASYIRIELQSVFTEIEKDSKWKKQSAKTFENLETLLKDRFFSNYNNYATFQQLFKDKSFNAATAAALYVIIFEAYEIPFQIEQSHFAIDLIVFPEDKKIRLHMLSDQKRALMDQEHFNEEYINLLKALKVIEDKELIAPRKQQIISSYYLPDQHTITPQQLSGELHFLQALALYHQKRYDLAIKHLEFADQQYPLARNGIIRRACMLQTSTSKGDPSTDNSSQIFELYKKHPLQEYRRSILDNFNNECLFIIEKEKKSDKIDKVYHRYKEGLSFAPDVLHELHLIYLSRKGSFYVKNDNYYKAENYIDSLFSLKPNDKNVQTIIRSFVQKKTQ